MNAFFIHVLLLTVFLHPRSFAQVKLCQPSDSDMTVILPKLIDHLNSTLACDLLDVPSQPEMEASLAGRGLDQDLDELTRGSSVQYKGASCKTALCKAKAIWGNTAGVKILYLKKKFGINAASATETGEKEDAGKSIRFTPKELDQIIYSAQNLPAVFFPLNGSTDFHFYRVNRTEIIKGAEGRTLQAAADTNDHRIRVFTEVGDSSMAHEMAHVLYSQKGADFQNKWTRKAGWIQKGGKWSNTLNQFVSTYAGSTNNYDPPNEDFAESIESFMYDPQALSDCCGSKYDFIKNQVFSGHDFTLQNCFGLSLADLAKIQLKIHPIERRFKKSPNIDLDTLIRCCGPEAAGTLNASDPLSNRCFREYYLEEDSIFNKMNPSKLIENAKALGIKLDLQQAQYVLSKLQWLEHSNLSSKLEDMLSPDEWKKFKNAASEAMTKLNESAKIQARQDLEKGRAKVRETIEFGKKNTPALEKSIVDSFAAFRGAEKDAFAALLFYGSYPANVTRFEAAGMQVFAEDPDFKAERDWIKQAAKKTFVKIFTLNPGASGSSCFDFVGLGGGSQTAYLLDVCDTMRRLNYDPKTDGIDRYLDDLFDGKMMDVPTR